MKPRQFNFQRLLLVWLVARPLLALANVPDVLPQEMGVRVWGQSQGLPNNSVTAVLQTRDGYLWVGTSAGLARFDGLRFVVFALGERTAHESLGVTALCEDAEGRLWIGTQNDGLLYFADGAVRRFWMSGASLDTVINSIAEDGAGNLWLGTPFGLVRLGKEGLTRFTTKDGLPGDFVSNVHAARSGVIWITTRGGMCQFKNGQISQVPLQTESPGRNPESLGVYEDSTGNLWAFGDTYLVNLTEGKHLNHFGSGDNSAASDNLSALRIWSLCEGHRGELWIGTSGKGLYCFANGKFSPVTLHNGGLTGDVRALCEDRDGNLWLGTYGGGLVRLQPRNERILDSAAGLPDRQVTCLDVTAQGRVWLGFDSGGLYAGTPERFEHFSGSTWMGVQNLVASIALAPDSSLWVGTPGMGLVCVTDQRVMHYTTANGLSDDHVLAVAADAEGDIWAGTLSGGLNCLRRGEVTRYGVEAGLPARPLTAILPAGGHALWIGDDAGGVLRGESGRFHSVINPPVLGGLAVRALHQDAAGRLWVGTAGSYLACVVAETYSNWNLNLGGVEDPILGIVSDEEGGLWLGTSKAVYHLPADGIQSAITGESSPRMQLVYKTEASVAAAPSYGWPLAGRSTDGKLWFGTGGGVIVINPRRLPVSILPPPVVMENMVVNGGLLVKPSAATSDRATVRLPSDLRSLDIQFAAVNLSEPEKLRFRHRLDGSDPDWVDDGDKRSAHYGRLAYGSYRFRVQAGLAEAWGAPETTFSFLVPTPWWRTNWALAVCVTASTAVVAGIARMASNRRLRLRLLVLAQQQAMERERMRIAQDMHDEIGSKLTKISFMSERAKNELQGQTSVSNKLSSIASTSRDLLQSLDEIVWVVNPRNDTLEHLAAYLGHYATEYLQNTTVECEVYIPQGLPHHSLSAETRHNLFLAFQEALNNALKHGNASLVRVQMRLESASFEIRVEDNGCGFDADAITSRSTLTVSLQKREGHGMQNLRARLAEVGGKCDVRSRIGEGTTVTLTVPLAAAKHI